jgi:GR25 family glycosyltransferase involved in LPS biosynthesis
VHVHTQNNSQKRPFGEKNKIMELAPIVLFAYSRPKHVQETLDSLERNLLAKDSDLFIYCDGPKKDSSKETLENIREVRSVVRKKKWCNKVTIIESEINKGLANSIIGGVTDIVNKFTKIIVIEDDVLLSPYFLQYMNDALQFYKNNNKVLSVGSWSYFCSPDKIKQNTYFFRFPDTKGWATFDRAWKLFEPDANKLLIDLKEKKLIKKFNANLSFPYFTNMLIDQIDGKINSWAIRWTAVSILNNGYSLFPKQTLSKDIGFGKGATHEKNTFDYNLNLTILNEPVLIDKIIEEENTQAVEEWVNFHTRNFKPENQFILAIKKFLIKIFPKRFLIFYKSLQSEKYD